jgi:hypothetical protein
VQRLVALIPQARSLVTSLQTFLAALPISPLAAQAAAASSSASLLGLPPLGTQDILPPPGAQTDTAYTDAFTEKAFLPPAPPFRTQEEAEGAHSGIETEQHIRSHFATLRAELTRREEQLLGEVHLQRSLKQLRQGQFRESVRRVVEQAQLALEDAVALAGKDDSVVCVRYKSVASSLEAALLSPLHEEEEAGPTDRPELGIGVTLTSMPLIATIRQYGTVGPPPVPLQVRCTLAPHALLTAEDGAVQGEGEGFDEAALSGRVILTWLQRRSASGSGGAVRFRIQRGVCDNLPGPYLHAPSSAIGIPTGQDGSDWGLDEEATGCSVGPSSTPMGRPVDRHFDGDYMAEHAASGSRCESATVESAGRAVREVGRLLLFETIGEVDAAALGASLAVDASSAMEAEKEKAIGGGLRGADAQEDEEEEEDDDSLLIHGKNYSLLGLRPSSLSRPHEGPEDGRTSASAMASRSQREVGLSGTAETGQGSPAVAPALMQCVSTPVSPETTASARPPLSTTAAGVFVAEGARTGAAEAGPSAAAAAGFAFVTDVSHFASHVVHFRVQAIDSTGE